MSTPIARRRRGVVACGSLLGLALPLLGQSLTTAVASEPAAPAATPAADGEANARATAERLIRQHDKSLQIGAGDEFQALPVLTSGEGIFYAPYERTHRGLPVFGGDFVVVTDRDGTLLTTSVAQTERISLPSVQAGVSSATALATAEDTLDQTNKATAPDKIVYALGSPRLAWKVEVAGVDAGERAALEVFVDAEVGQGAEHRGPARPRFRDGALNGPGSLPLLTTQSGSTFT